MFSGTNAFNNLIPNVAQVRQPRGIILINNKPVKWVNIHTTTTTFYMADRFSLELPLNGQISPFTLDYWASSPQFDVKVYIGFPKNPDVYSTQDLDLMMVGEADDVQVDLLAARVMISGRDNTSKFIDNSTTEKFPNKTSSYIVTQFAKQQGLNPVVTATTTIVGTFYENQQTLLSREVTQWDLMTFLAQQENFVLFVRNNDLVFEPRQTTSQNPYILKYAPPTIIQASPTFNGMALSISRSTTLAKDVQVTVKVPYNPKTGKAFSVTKKATHRKRSYLKDVPEPSKVVQKFSYIFPGLTPEQASQRAQQLLQNITIHEVNLTASMPGDNVLKKDSLIQLTGTNTSLDQFYYADQVDRQLSISEGYSMTISAKNHSVDSEVSL